MEPESGTPAEDRFERGRALFDRGLYFEAHEVWEEIWLTSGGSERRVLQALIQIAAGYHKAFQERNAQGCVRLLEAGVSRLEGEAPLPARLSAFAAGVRASVIPARRWEGGEIEALDPASAARLGPETGVNSG